MTAEELRAGNLVYVPMFFVCAVTHIDAVNQKVAVAIVNPMGVKEGDVWYEIQEVSPLPLNEHWFERVTRVRGIGEKSFTPRIELDVDDDMTETRLEFRKTGTNTWDCWMVIEVYEDVDDDTEKETITEVPLPPITALHQLQNFYFAYCGKELNFLPYKP